MLHSLRYHLWKGFLFFEWLYHALYFGLWTSNELLWLHHHLLRHLVCHFYVLSCMFMLPCLYFATLWAKKTQTAPQNITYSHTAKRQNHKVHLINKSMWLANAFVYCKRLLDDGQNESWQLAVGELTAQRNWWLIHKKDMTKHPNPLVFKRVIWVVRRRTIQNYLKYLSIES